MKSDLLIENHSYLLNLHYSKDKLLLLLEFHSLLITYISKFSQNVHNFNKNISAYMLRYRRILNGRILVTTILYGRGEFIMEIICGKCKVEFKEEDQVVLDIFSNVTHEECYDDNPGFITTTDSYKEISESYANLVD
jgi:hypothetical protein